MAGRYHLVLCSSSFLLFILNGLVFGQLTSPYSMYEKDCPEENTPMMYIDVPWGVPGRAYKTLPPGLIIAPSKLPGAGFGVISETFIPRYTWLGLYDGEIVDVKHQDYISNYAFQVRRGGVITAYIDAFHFHTSSWVRYVNAPNRHRDENVEVAECYGRIYYLTKKDVVPGDELLVFYGYDFNLGIDTNVYYEVPQGFVDGGLDLKKLEHRTCVHQQGYDLFEVKDLPLSLLPKLLCTKEETVISKTEGG